MQEYTSGAVERRTIEESLCAAHGCADNADKIVASILAMLEGHPYSNEPETASQTAGIIARADYLASRLQSLIGELLRIQERISSPKAVQMTGVASQAQNYVAGNRLY